jgi:ubiquinone/menaquinone biosynthesis C-methylase UbiE
MTVIEAAALIADPRLDGVTWADLGCGEGTFTQALATLLPSGSVVHAMDRDRAALRRMPAARDGTTILTHVGDFTRMPWPFTGLDGVLMANSLHYVADPRGWLRACESALIRRRFLIVEYDTTQANPWVPYPLDRKALAALFHKAGYRSVEILRSRPSRYGRAPLYSALVDVN